MRTRNWVVMLVGLAAFGLLGCPSTDPQILGIWKSTSGNVVSVLSYSETETVKAVYVAGDSVYAVWAGGKYTADPAKTPNEIDVDLTWCNCEGTGQEDPCEELEGVTRLGIYKIEGDQLYVDSDPQQRPTNFDNADVYTRVGVDE